MTLRLAAFFVALTLGAGPTPHPALAGSALVPDDFSTVQSAIDSGADTVFIRAGVYSERPLVDHPLVLQGIGVGQRPQLAGLDITNQNFIAYPPPHALTVSWISFSGRVDYSTVADRPRGLVFSFYNCSLASGFHQVQSGDPYDIATLTIRDCTLGGASSARVDRLVMERDTIVAAPARPSGFGVLSLVVPPPGAASWDLSIATVQHCVFNGGGLTLTGNPWTNIAFNRFANCVSAITVLDAAAAVIESNTIAQSTIGICVTGQWVDIVDNNISGCGIGVYSGQTTDLRVRRNTIAESGNQGILADGSSLVLAENNVVVGGGNGPRIETGYAQSGIGVGYSFRDTIRNNTIVGDAGSGIGLDHGDLTLVENNIVFGNQGWGMAVVGGGQVSVGCNDWFGNNLGAVAGVALGATDWAVDPLFCDTASVDMRLMSSSPLVGSPECGPIGALGVGCGPTATTVLRFSGARVGDGVRVIWEVGESATATDIWLERWEAGDRAGWTVPATERFQEGRAVVEVDRGVFPDRAYSYRLVALESAVRVVIGAPILIESLAPRQFRLNEVGPNPGAGPLRIAFTLEHAAAIEIDVFDLHGRKVASLGGGAWSAGPHELEWDGRGRSGKAIPQGMYVVRYVFPGGQDRRPIMLIR